MSKASLDPAQTETVTPRLWSLSAGVGNIGTGGSSSGQTAAQFNAPRQSGADASRQADQAWKSDASPRSNGATQGNAGDTATTQQENNRPSFDVGVNHGGFLAQLLGQQETFATQSVAARPSSQATASYQAADQLAIASPDDSVSHLSMPGLPPVLSTGRRLDLSI